MIVRARFLRETNGDSEDEDGDEDGEGESTSIPSTSDEADELTTDPSTDSTSLSPKPTKSPAASLIPNTVPTHHKNASSLSTLLFSFLESVKYFNVPVKESGRERRAMSGSVHVSGGSASVRCVSELKMWG